MAYPPGAAALMISWAVSPYLGRSVMHRRLLALSALALIVAAGTPTSGLVDRTHGVRDALIEAGSRFSGIADIITGVHLARSLHS
ncbi:MULTISPECIES: hypothetical protein [Nonomuraea]|uniref:Uncharacterized protein n=1 Tax=Nonomuraea salmonea TaxID=46181 RepID=A0ABV5NR12_9ACTN